MGPRADNNIILLRKLFGFLCFLRTFNFILLNLSELLCFLLARYMLAASRLELLEFGNPSVCTLNGALCPLSTSFYILPCLRA